MDQRVASLHESLTGRSQLRVPGWLPGGLSLLVISLILFASLSALFFNAQLASLTTTLFDPYLLRVLRFTLWQASLSTLLSVLLAIPVARALARRTTFRGRSVLLLLLGLPVATPVIVVIFGIVEIYGNNGTLNHLIRLFGFSFQVNLYGLTGILIAHLFFNMPLAVRMLLPAWNQIPDESWRLASQLGMKSGSLFKLIEWPVLRRVLPGSAGIIFLLCFASFAIVLVLGGGPRATTIEVAIYQALRFDFEPSKAALLALIQLVICTLTVALLHHWLRALPLSSGLATTSQNRPDLNQPGSRLIDFGIILVATTFVALPLLALVRAGLTGPVLSVISDQSLWSAALNSLMIAIAAAGIAFSLGMALLTTSRYLRFHRKQPNRSELLELSGSLTLVVPPMVIATGLFSLLLPFGFVFDWGLVLVAMINGLMVLPYVIRLVGPALLANGEHYHHLCSELGIRGWHQFKLIDWPIIRHPAAFSMGLCATLSFGDLGVVALFGTHDAMTLPLLLYHRIGAYQFEAASVTALILALLCLVVFRVIDLLIGGRRALH